MEVVLLMDFQNKLVYIKNIYEIIKDESLKFPQYLFNFSQ